MASIFQAIMEIQERYQDALLRKQNVVGVAAGYRFSGGQPTDEPAVAVLVQQKKPVAALSADDLVPAEIDGVRTDVYEVGYLQAQQQTMGLRSEVRPIPGGVSIGHFKVTAGTLGVMVRDRTTGDRFLLSNNHVLANSNEALKGDPILQPGPTDGGEAPDDVVAKLERFIPMKYLEGDIQPPDPDPTPDPRPDPTPDPRPDPPPRQPVPGDSGCDVVNAMMAIGNVLARLSGSQKRLTASTQAVGGPTMTGFAAQTTDVANTVDAALARPINQALFLDEIANIGLVQETVPPALGMRIRKTGRTTGYTESTITLLNATVNVAYNTSQGPRTARFTGQVIADPMSQGGDSGSLIVETGVNRAVGLLFAGSPLATIFTPISTVFNALNVELGPAG
jgi:hypothetical protein